MQGLLDGILVSPWNGAPLTIGEHVVGGDGERFPVRGGIPRFVETVDYAESFADQWKRWRRVQLDSEHGKGLSRRRLFEGTRWRPEELEGKLVLEAGCGAGRFTEVLLDAGAYVVAVDGTTAVDACRETCGPHPRLALVQADILALPFRCGSFDRVFCYGVLQHTPNPEYTFRRLLGQVRPGGLIAADIYRPFDFVDRWSSKNLWRPLTTRVPPDLLRKVIEFYVPRWLTVDDWLHALPRVGRYLTALVPCWNPRGLFDELTDEEMVAWAVLDTFDALAAKYDNPRSVAEVESWCARAGLTDVDVHAGGNGVEVNGRRPQ